MRERLQKILARAGHGSRRHCETLITGGRVRVNGEVAELGAQADADTDRIEVDGTDLVFDTAMVYLAMNKPPGVLTTATDPHGRRTVMDLLPPNLPPHFFSIGRLDRDTEGLLLFTSDGELAHRLAHPRYEMDKEYYALVSGTPAQEAVSALQRGIEVDGRLTSPAEAEVGRVPYGHRARADHTWLRIVIHEGRKRQVRLMCAAVGHPVRELVRTRIGRIELGRLAPGTTRTLASAEVMELRKLVQLA